MSRQVSRLLLLGFVGSDSALRSRLGATQTRRPATALTADYEPRNSRTARHA